MANALSTQRSTYGFKSPWSLSLVISLALHSLALASPAVVGWLQSGTSSSLPHGGPVVIDWMEIQGTPEPPQKVVRKQKVRAKVPKMAESAVPVDQKVPENPARNVAERSGFSSPRAHTLGSPDGLSSEALRYHDELYLLFEARKTYPLAARRLNQQGEVLISMRIWADGKIDDQRVIKPSPYERLNEAALGMVRQVEQFKPLPKDSGPYAYFHLPVEYSLN